jgi:hypothetical protein
MKETLLPEATSQRNGHPFPKTETDTHEYGTIKLMEFSIFSGRLAPFSYIALEGHKIIRLRTSNVSFLGSVAKVRKRVY